MARLVVGALLSVYYGGIALYALAWMLRRTGAALARAAAQSPDDGGWFRESVIAQWAARRRVARAGSPEPEEVLVA